MTFLKNKTAWKKWLRDETIEVSEEPKHFPCFGDTHVADWGMQYTGAHYLYFDDLVTMLQCFAVVMAQTKGHQ